MLASYLKPFANRPEPAAILNSVHEICVNSLKQGQTSTSACSRPRLIVSSNDQLSPWSTCSSVLDNNLLLLHSDSRLDLRPRRPFLCGGGEFRGSMLD